MKNPDLQLSGHSTAIVRMYLNTPNSAGFTTNSLRKLHFYQQIMFIRAQKFYGDIWCFFKKKYSLQKLRHCRISASSELIFFSFFYNDWLLSQEKKKKGTFRQKWIKLKRRKIATGLKSLGKAEEKPTQLPRTMEKSLLGIHNKWT